MKKIFVRVSLIIAAAMVFDSCFLDGLARYVAATGVRAGYRYAAQSVEEFREKFREIMVAELQNPSKKTTTEPPVETAVTVPAPDAKTEEAPPTAQETTVRVVVEPRVYRIGR
ncbi:MAG: hypothetical protein LBQ54_15675 [Planctomycetaceae bacterium]|jgi:hypothetical protein|nr:hypothetical protein [Planctomycetaceae bacterium]